MNYCIYFISIVSIILSIFIICYTNNTKESYQQKTCSFTSSFENKNFGTKYQKISGVKIKKLIQKLHNKYRKQKHIGKDLSLEPSTCNNPLERRAQDFANWLAKLPDLTSLFKNSGSGGKNYNGAEDKHNTHVIADAGAWQWSNHSNVANVIMNSVDDSVVNLNFLAKAFIGAHTPIDILRTQKFANSITNKTIKNCKKNANKCIENSNPMPYVKDAELLLDKNSEKYPGLGNKPSTHYQKGGDYADTIIKETNNSNMQTCDICSDSNNNGWPAGGCDANDPKQKSSKCNKKLERLHSYWAPKAYVGTDCSCDGLVSMYTIGDSHIGTTGKGLHDGQLAGMTKINKSSRSIQTEIENAVERIFNLWTNTKCGNYHDCKISFMSPILTRAKQNLNASVWSQLHLKTTKYLGIGISIKDDILFLVCNYDARSYTTQFEINHN